MSQQKSECVYFGCGKEPLRRSKGGYCIYHARAEDKDEREFKEALKKYIEEKNYYFSGFVFVGKIDFKRDFGVTIFKEANFWRASFRGDVNFSSASFQGWVTFSEASFHEEASFTEASFHGKAGFERASFRKYVSFGSASFQGRAGFSEASFQEGASFGETSFHGKAGFERASFRKYVSFAKAAFRENVNFREASFQEKVYFSEVEFQGTASISPKCVKGNVLSMGAILENVSLTPLNLGKDTWIDFTGARLRNTEIRREDIEDYIRQEQEKDFSGAKEIYLLLKNNFHTTGRYDDESWAFEKEKDMERKSYFHTRRLRWLGSMFWNLLYGYGERPFRIFGWCGFLLFFSSFIYWLSKGVFHVIGTDLALVEDYWNNLYFSVVTFTTLGYGDFRPIGTVKVLASIEALLGIFLIALFIFAFARKTGGR